MPPSATRLLEQLVDLKPQFGGEHTRRKRELLTELEGASLPSAEQVLELHELLCFWRAYPDSRDLLRQVERMLAGFADRKDLRRHRRALQDSGVAGSEIHYEFYMQMAQMIAERWPALLHIDWAELRSRERRRGQPHEGGRERLDKIVHLLALYGETPGLDELAYSIREWFERLKGEDEGDGAFLARRIASIPMDPFVREYFYEHLAVPMIVRAAPDGPSRTRARAPGKTQRGEPSWQTRPLDGRRPDLRVELERPPESIQPVSTARGRELIDLARESMLTRSRDLDAFAFGDPRDVRMIECGSGLQFAAIGVLPERRLFFEAVYGFLTLKNGVPIGYVLNSALFHSVEVAYNVFETYRGGEAGLIYGRLLAALRHLFAADTFTIYPYQLGGDGNYEGLQSGAWWFYQKLGFRARDEDVLRRMRRELARMKRNPRHRSSIATLEELSVANVFYDHGGRRDDVIGILPMGRIGLHVTDYLAGRFGSRRQEAIGICAREAQELLGLASLRGFSAGERLAWGRWAPLALILPGIARWSGEEKQALVDVIRAKGGRRESDFVLLFDGHAKLRRALRRLTELGID